MLIEKFINVNQSYGIRYDTNASLLFPLNPPFLFATLFLLLMIYKLFGRGTKWKACWVHVRVPGIASGSACMDTPRSLAGHSPRKPLLVVSVHTVVTL